MLFLVAEMSALLRDELHYFNDRELTAIERDTPLVVVEFSDDRDVDPAHALLHADFVGFAVVFGGDLVARDGGHLSSLFQIGKDAIQYIINTNFVNLCSLNSHSNRSEYLHSSFQEQELFMLRHFVHA